MECTSSKGKHSGNDSFAVTHQHHCSEFLLTSSTSEAGGCRSPKVTLRLTPTHLCPEILPRKIAKDETKAIDPGLCA